MMTDDVSLRPARPGDAAAAAPLIHAAGPTLFSLMFGPDPAAVRRLFAALFRRPDNPFSHEHAMIAEQKGRLVGISLAGTVARRHAGGWQTLFFLLRHRTPLALLRAFSHVRDIAACTSAPPDGAYYLSILSVAEDARSKGIGARLLAQVCEDGAQAGCKVVALHAETGNARAQNFYRRHGFVTTGERAASAKLAAAGVAGLTAMRKDLR